jgi:hypothetical protein
MFYNGSLIAVRRPLSYQCFLMTYHNAAKHAPPPPTTPPSTRRTSPHAHPSGHIYVTTEAQYTAPRPTH